MASHHWQEVLPPGRYLAPERSGQEEFAFPSARGMPHGPFPTRASPVKQVHTNLARTQLLGERDRNRIDYSFACTVGGPLWRRHRPTKDFCRLSVEVSQS